MKPHPINTPISTTELARRPLSPNQLDMIPTMAWQTFADDSCAGFNIAWQSFTGKLRSANERTTWILHIHPDEREQIVSAQFAALTARRDVDLEYRLLRNDGQYRWVHSQGKPQYAEDGSYLGAIGIINDITAFKETQIALQEAENRWQIALDCVGDGVWDWYPAHNKIIFSASWKKIFGYGENDLRHGLESWLTLIHPDDIGQTRVVIDSYRAGHITQHQLEFRARRGDGCYAWILARGRVVSYSREGAAERITGTLTDITDLKSAAESLRHDEQHLLLAMGHAQMGWFARDLNNDIGIGSPSIATIYGLDNPVGPWHYDEIRARIVPEDLPRHRAEIAQSLSQAESSTNVCTFNYRIKRPDGEVRHIEVRYRNEFDNVRPRAFGLVFDVTAAKQTEQALLETDARLQTALENAHMAWFERDISTGNTRCSRALWRMYGLDATSDVPLTFEKILARVHPDDCTQHQATIPRLLEETHDPHTTNVIRYRVLQRTGEYRWVEVRYRVELNPTTVTGRVYGFVLDVHQNHMIEQTLRDSQARLRLAVESANTATWYWDTANDTVYSLDNLQQLYALPTAGPWHLSELTPLIHPDDLPRLLACIDQARKGAETALNMELRIGPRGSEKWIEMRANWNAETDPRGPGFYGVSLDVTERKLSEIEQKRLHAQVQQAQKMESIGLLTGGIAHDFNNILSAILGYTCLALQLYGKSIPPKLGGYLNEVQQAGERARDLISQMLAFSRGETGELKAIDLPELVRNSLRMFRPTFPSSIDIRYIESRALPLVNADTVQLQQLLLNLCINARDAMAGNGHISIASELRRTERAVCESCQTDFSGNYVVLSVQDNGPGIPHSIRPRIFEPFFTTKAVTSGTGMGLAMVHGIAHRFGGHLQLITMPDKGACFELWIPEGPGSVGPENISETINDTPVETHAGARILVVDDEAPIARFLAELLEMHGYEVSTETDSTRALAAIRAAPAMHSLVITDQTMPGLTGAQLVKELAKLAQPPPVIMMTGYSSSIDEEKAADMGIRTFLRKPIRGDDVVQAVRDTLRTIGHGIGAGLR